jgi:hypothetical protein
MHCRLNKKNMKKQINEEINSMKFLLNYKRGVVISEQTNNAEDVGIIMRELDKTNSDESNIVNIIKKYKDKSSFKAFIDQYKTISGKDFGAEIRRAISPNNDPTEWNALKTHLATMGITLGDTTTNGGNSSVATFTGLDTPAATTTTPNWSKYPCVPKHPQAKKGKTAKGSEYYQINDYYYYDNGRKYQISTKKIINYTCNDPEFKVNVSTLGNKVNNTVNEKPTIPSELKNIEGVKLFQDWLDVNAKGWAKDFANGILNKSAGYGNFGPRTQKAWKTYGRKYLDRNTDATTNTVSSFTDFNQRDTTLPPFEN